MRVLITGAAGFLGRHFMQHHLEMGDQVVALDNFQSPYADDPLGEVLHADCRDHFQRDLSEFDRVYHFAAMVGGREKIEEDPLYNANSLELDAALFRAVAKSPPGLVIYPSSSAVYGARHQTGDVRRKLGEAMVDPSQQIWDQPDEMYGFTKLAGEYMAWKAQRYGVRTLCIRPFSGYGPDQSPDYPMRAIADRVIKRKDPLLVWGSGTQVRDWVHVDDIVRATFARAFAFDLDSPDGAYEAMNIGSGQGHSFVEIARAMAEIAGYRPDIATVLSKPEGVRYRVADPEKMFMYWEPTVSLDTGLRQMLDG